MSNNNEKPSAEAKALSLFLMAHKSSGNVYKEKSKRINRLWSLVSGNELTQEEYLKEVNETLQSFGGYGEVVKKTVEFYIQKTGKWTLQGDDQYCQDAGNIATELLKDK